MQARWHLWLGLGAILWAVPGFAAEMRASKPDVKRAVVDVIETQLAAFRAGDVPRAYTFAAAELRAQKPLPVFAEIVRVSYPEIWSSRRSEAGIVRDDGARATVTMAVYSDTGDARYDYTLVREAVGWRINGVLRHAPKKSRL